MMLHVMRPLIFDYFQAHFIALPHAVIALVLLFIMGYVYQILARDKPRFPAFRTTSALPSSMRMFPAVKLLPTSAPGVSCRQALLTAIPLRWLCGTCSERLRVLWRLAERAARSFHPAKSAI